MCAALRQARAWVDATRTSNAPNTSAATAHTNNATHTHTHTHTHPHAARLDVLGAVQQPLVQDAHAPAVPLADLKVDVALPQRLGHVQQRLGDGELEERPRARRLAELRLELGKLGGGGARARVWVVVWEGRQRVCVC